MRITIVAKDGTNVGPLYAETVSFLNDESYGKLFDGETVTNILYVWPSNCLSVKVEDNG